VIHPLLALTVTAWLLYRCLEAGSPEQAGLRKLIAIFAIAQLLSGFANIFLLAAIPIQLLHLTLADCLWIALVSWTWFAEREAKPSSSCI
jgi:heme A synthase